MCFLFARWAKKLPVGRSGFFSFFFNFVFYKLECIGGKVNKEKSLFKIWKKNSHFSPLGRWTGNNILFKDDLSSRLLHSDSGYPRHRENRENRENGPKNSLSGKTQGIWKFCQNTGKTKGILSKHKENTGNFVSSSCKCSDSKSKGYYDSWRQKNAFFFQKLDRSAKSVLCM